MRILLRSDAGVQMGTGHVMRCLTLAEELLSRGHEVTLLGSLGDVAWLHEQVEASGVLHRDAMADSLDVDQIPEARFERVVVDSYTIPAASISELDSRVPTLAIIDGDDRGILASAYLDQNIGAERAPVAARLGDRLLAGSRFALVRRAVLAERRADAWRVDGSPHVVAFMGGTDPGGAIVTVTESLLAAPADARLTLVCAPRWLARVTALVETRAGARALGPVRELPALLGDASLVVSATGTSAWDICTLGVPAVFVALVGNQQDGLRRVVESGLALGIDAADDPDRAREAGPLAVGLLQDEAARRTLSERCLAEFDGRGAARVADALEAL